jgi:hypothetical protein
MNSGKKPMTKMFTINGKPMKTWSPITGCLHGCVYCWAKDLAEGKLSQSRKYQEGFKPAFHEVELKRKFKAGWFVFVSSMGDAFGEWVPRGWILRVLDVIRRFPEAHFLLQTKNPGRFFEFLEELTPNIYLGTTIETNRDYEITAAPSPMTRYLDFWTVEWPHKFISIEPIMDFSVTVLVRWMGHLKPEIIEVGADNHHKGLPEPPWGKVQELLAELRGVCPTVVEKDGLERLEGVNG